MDFKTITDGLTTIKELVDLITKIGEETNNLALQKAILELDKKNYILEKEILELKRKLDKRDTHNMCFSKEDNCYYDIKNGNEKDDPFCSKCYDATEKCVRMLGYHTTGMYKCPNCNTQIITSAYKEDKRDTRISW